MTDNFCAKTASIWQFIGYGLFALKIVIPLIVIILGIMDFAKAVVRSDDNANRNASITLIQRFILAVCIFFVPTIVHIVIGLVSDLTKTKDSIEACETCLLKPVGDNCENLKAKRNK
ncbi:hypothetical protein EGR52_02520 [bacterium]|nr:hypothetical protein [bacterium]MBD8922282.1 hypothetical protein [bacterium]